MKRILLIVLALLLIPAMAFASGKGIDPITNQTVLAIGGVDSSGNIRGLRVDAGGRLSTSQFASGYYSVSDTSFVSGDSPVTLDINAALGRNAEMGFIICDGLGDFTIELSDDGSSFGSAFTLKDGETFSIEGMSVDSIRITHSGTDSAYRVFAR